MTKYIINGFYKPFCTLELIVSSWFVSDSTLTMGVSSCLTTVVSSSDILEKLLFIHKKSKINSYKKR